MKLDREQQALHLGLFVLRVGIGAIFLFHGYPKLLGGTELWAKLGGAIGAFGITFAPAFWGFLAAITEFAGGLALILGIAVRPVAAAMAGVMVVALTMHLGKGDPFNAYSNALKALVVFLALTISGAGYYRLGGKRSGE